MQGKGDNKFATYTKESREGMLTHAHSERNGVTKQLS